MSGQALSMDLLKRIAAGEAGIAGGVAAATAGAAAAALVERAARESDSAWVDRKGAVAQARALRARLERLASLDAEAFADAQTELRGVAAPSSGQRDHVIGVALRRAAEVPEAIAHSCADVAELAAEAAMHAGDEDRADAAVASMLAAGAAQGAEHLVRINLVALGAGPVVERAAAAAARARTGADRARARSI
jgi:formiminotetrahydrofolate cyclodeaminase